MTSSRRPASFPIIDSHVHLFPASEVDTLAWWNPDSDLVKQQSLDEYAAATGCPPQLRGCVLVEADRKNGGDATDWAGPLQEIAWLRRVVEGKPREGEGHTAGDAKLCLGIVPWAPLNLGAGIVEEYLAEAELKAGKATWSKVKGFRFLLQDKPAGTGLTHDFIAGLKVLGKKGFVFDVGVDHHRRGQAQLEEAAAMIDRAHEDTLEGEKVVFVLNHLCKPDFSIVKPQTDPSFIAWRIAMFSLGTCEHTYMKLSGCFSEMPDALKNRPAADVFAALYPWLAVVLAAFGPNRIMFASDWPICTVGVADPGEEAEEKGAWRKWRKMVERMCDMASLSVDDQIMLWAGTARRAYGLDD